MSRSIPDSVECQHCGSAFNLAVQSYYDNVCPGCMREREPERLARVCAACDTRVMPDDVISAQIRDVDGTMSHVPACSESCKRSLAEPVYRGP